MENNKILDDFNEETDDIENVKDRFTYTLSKPITYNETKYESLTIDFEKLKGKDARAIATELQSLGITLIVPTLSEDYLVRVIVKACAEPVGIDFIDEISMFDYNKLIARAKAFLLKSERPSPTTAKI